jgi:hypothetical protein
MIDPPLTTTRTAMSSSVFHPPLPRVSVALLKFERMIQENQNRLSHVPSEAAVRRNLIQYAQPSTSTMHKEGPADAVVEHDESIVNSDSDNAVDIDRLDPILDINNEPEPPQIDTMPIQPKNAIRKTIPTTNPQKSSSVKSFVEQCRELKRLRNTPVPLPPSQLDLLRGYKETTTTVVEPLPPFVAPVTAPVRRMPLPVYVANGE